LKFFKVIGRVKWLYGEQTNVSKTISVLILRVVTWLDEEEESFYS
jgi:hypothetical protein